MGLRNTTAALVESLGSVEVKLLRVEVLVLFSTLIWVLLLLFGSFRRRRSDKSFRFLVWAVYTLSTVLAPYTIGLLQAGPFRDQTFALWGTILLLIQVSADSVSVYSIRDIEQRKRMLVEKVLQILLVLWLIINCSGRNKSYSATIWMFWILSAINIYRKSRVLRTASKREGLLEHAKVVADYMMVEHELASEDDATTMTGYKYIFHGEDELTSLLPTGPSYRIELKETTSKLTTIDSVWQWIDSQGESVFPKKQADTLKDVAISFTLFKLLKRRFCGYKLGEAGHPKTRHFVVRGLLSEKGNHVRAFEVIEMELSFLYDFFYTRFDLKFQYIAWSGIIVLTAIVWNSISGTFSRHYHRTNFEQIVNGADVIRWITIVLIAVLVVAFFVEMVIRPRRWLIVYDLHEVTAGAKMKLPSREDYRPAEGCWERKLGQYSLLLNFDYHPWNVLSHLSLGLIETTREGQKVGKKIELPEEVIVRVLSRFKENEGHLANGQSALARNQLVSQFSWACTLPTHIHTVLVWHIGTTICENTWSQQPPTGDLLVSKSLSDYCAYLVAFVPDMLPGHAYDTQRIFDAVVEEARKCLAGCETMSSRCEKMMGLLGSNSTILEMGAKLGRELRDNVPDEARRWKALADFWVEFILFLAPSSNADIHADMLAAGGEFMTHLWALLTHAGILERPSSSAETDAAGGPEGYSNDTTAQDSAV